MSVFLSLACAHSDISFQNFGILIAFGVAFFFGLLIFTEFNTSTVNDVAVVLFKRGSKSVIKPAGTSDEETLQHQEKLPVNGGDARVETEKKDQSTTTTDIFSWQHIDYTVPIPGHDDRKLLSDVSGYVAPGKLTALMGESGAGKTTLLNVLAQRVNVGVVTGDKFVNGQSLPKDFQSQTYVTSPIRKQKKTISLTASY